MSLFVALVLDRHVIYFSVYQFFYRRVCVVCVWLQCISAEKRVLLKWFLLIHVVFRCCCNVSFLNPLNPPPPGH